jgi:hypothetical protein
LSPLKVEFERDWDMRSMRKENGKGLEDGDEVPNPLLLVLGNAL